MLRVKSVITLLLSTSGLCAANFSPKHRTLTPTAVTRHAGLIRSPTALHTGRRGATTSSVFPFTLHGPGAFAVLDFGQEVGGFTTVYFGRVDHGTSVGLAYSESSNFAACPAPLTPSGTPCDHPHAPCACQFGANNQSGAGDHSNGGAGPDLTLSTGPLASQAVFKPAQAQMRGGFRYLNLFLEHAGEVTVENVSLFFTPAPGMENPAAYKNHFHSSDPLLDTIWYGCAYTTQMCSISSEQGRQWGPPSSGWNNGVLIGLGNSLLVDGAKRDRTIWPGDMGVSVATALATTGEVNSSLNSLATLFALQHPVTGMLPYVGPAVFCNAPQGQECSSNGRYNSDMYHMWALVGAWNLWSATADIDWLRSVWPVYVKAVKCSLGKVRMEPDPKTHKLLPCPAGQHADVVRAAHDNGSCDCDTYCATDWSGTVKEARPHWTGAASGVPGAKLDCQCVQATHWCPKNSGKCSASCDSLGKPTPRNYCIDGPPPPDAGGLMVVDQTADWARAGQGGKNIAANALLFHVLSTAAKIAEVLGKHTEASEFGIAADKLKTAINGPTLWDEARGAFRDNPQSKVYPQDGNSLAIWFNVTTRERSERISQYLATNLGQFGSSSPEWNYDIGTFPGSMEVNAHLSLGGSATQRGLDLIRRQWGYMIRHPNSTQSTFWEGYHKDGSFAYQTIYMSHSHGWATGPGSALQHFILGIRPVGASAGPRPRHHYIVAPSPGDLSFCEGSLSFGGGKVDVSWQATQHRFTLNLNATQHPKQSEAALAIPLPAQLEGSQVVLKLDGTTVWAAVELSTQQQVVAGALLRATGIHIDGLDKASRRLRATLQKARAFQLDVLSQARFVSPFA